MSIYVIDASVAAKWFLKEEYNEEALSLFDVKNKLHAPDFLLLEMDNVLWKWIMRGTIDTREGRNIRDTLRRYPIQKHPFLPLLDYAYKIANQTQRTVYDSLYISLATSLKGKMVTADRRLYNALANSPFANSVVWVGDMS